MITHIARVIFMNLLEFLIVTIDFTKFMEKYKKKDVGNFGCWSNLLWFYYYKRKKRRKCILLKRRLDFFKLYTRQNFKWDCLCPQNTFFFPPLSYGQHSIRGKIPNNSKMFEQLRCGFACHFPIIQCLLHVLLATVRGQKYARIEKLNLDM